MRSRVGRGKSPLGAGKRVRHGGGFRHAEGVHDLGPRFSRLEWGLPVATGRVAGGGQLLGSLASREAGGGWLRARLAGGV